eukprot:13441483-Alexandrium_andersonii.AAC.1
MSTNDLNATGHPHASVPSGWRSGNCCSGWPAWSAVWPPPAGAAASAAGATLGCVALATAL